MIDTIDVNLLIQGVAKKLKQEIEMPEWAHYVKTGANKQRPPVDDDWWFYRAAAILRTVDNKGPIGVSKLRIKFGGKKNRGMKPEHFFKGSGKIIRLILQQLEEKGYLTKSDTVHKGRVITNKGKSLLYSTSKELSN